MTAVPSANYSANTRINSRLYLRLIPLQMLLATLSCINMFIDGLFASNILGSEAMSAIGLFGPLNLVATVCGMVLFGGTQVLCGKFMGSNQIARTRSIFSMTILIVLVMGLTIGLVFITCADSLAGWLGATGETKKLLRDYIFGCSFAMLPQIMGQQLTSFLAIERKEKRSTFAVFCLIGSNVFMNWLFLSVLKMGLLGLALATSCSYLVFCVVLSTWFFKKEALFHFRFREIVWKDLGAIFKTGYVAALSHFYQIFRGLFINYTLLHYCGANSVAAFAIYNTLGPLLWAIPTGILVVYRLLCSVSVGEEDRRSLVDITRFAVWKMGAAVLLLGIACSLLAEPLTRIFISDINDPVYPIAVQVFRIYPLSLVLSEFCFVFVYYSQVMQKQLLIHLLAFMDGIGGTVLFGLLLVPNMGDTGMWMAQVLNGIPTTLIIILYARAVLKHTPRSVEDLLCLPESFGVPENARLDITVSDRAAVIGVSEKVQTFCLDRGIDARRAAVAALFIEEMAGNIAVHGFAADSKKHSIDIRVSHKEDDLILRIRDDCVPFDPLEWEGLLTSDDTCRNMGIRLVSGLVEDIKYQKLLGLNVLTLKL